MQSLMKLIPLICVLIAFTGCSSYKHGHSKIRFVRHSPEKSGKYYGSDDKLYAPIVYDDQKIASPLETSEDKAGSVVDNNFQNQKRQAQKRPSSIILTNAIVAAANIPKEMNFSEVASANNTNEINIKVEDEEEPKTNTMAILALIFSILGFIFFPFAIAAVICGKIAEQQVTDTGEKGLGLAQTAVTLGYIGLVLAILTIVLGFILLLAFFYLIN